MDFALSLFPSMMAAQYLDLFIVTVDLMGCRVDVSCSGNQGSNKHNSNAVLGYKWGISNQDVITPCMNASRS